MQGDTMFRARPARPDGRPVIALASWVSREGVEPEEGLLTAALAERGVRAEPVPWDDPAVQWRRYDGCLVRSTWDYPLRPAAFAGWARQLATAVPLWNPLPVLRWNLHKGYLLALGRRDVAVTPSVLVRAGELVDPAAAGAQLEADRLVIKPAIGNASRDIEFVDAGAASPRRPAQDILVQPFLPSMSGGEAPGEHCLVFFDGTFSHAVRRVPAPGSHLAHEWHGGSLCAFEPEPAQLDLASRALRVAAASTGSSALYARVDLVRAARGWVVHELELIEPLLYLQHEPAAAGRLAAAVADRLTQAARSPRPAA
jgi:glutathione synthase/RimK-type ligase-like ATP-grasp enzyme